jgi:negative regulator of flagellin synthesis FlgM
MKVTDTSQIQALAPTKPEPIRALSAERGSGAGDRVSTSESEKIARVIRQASQTASAGRAARLQSIETAVRQGTYRPDPARIAAQILDDAELAAQLQALFRK